jgi:hypothetical protein
MVKNFTFAKKMNAMKSVAQKTSTINKDFKTLALL